jgi:hypothetical protein
MKLFKYILLLLFFIIPLQAKEDKKIYFTEKEINSIIYQFEQDKKEIENYQYRENLLREETPQIDYEFLNGNEIKQIIIIPVYKDNPLKYEIKFKVKEQEKLENWVPLTLSLGGYLESPEITSELKFSDFIDVKIGVKLISLAKTQIHFIECLGINFLTGIKSSGVSLSYLFPKPFNNTNLHIFYGVKYSDWNGTGGLGISLNF